MFACGVFVVHVVYVYLCVHICGVVCVFACMCLWCMWVCACMHMEQPHGGPAVKPGIQRPSRILAHLYERKCLGGTLLSSGRLPVQLLFFGSDILRVFSYDV